MQDGTENTDQKIRDHSRPRCPHAQDFLTAAYLLTSKDRFYGRAEAGLFVCAMGDAAGDAELPPPALRKPLELWTGKQLFSMLIRPHSRVQCAPCSAPRSPCLQIPVAGVFAGLKAMPVSDRHLHIFVAFHRGCACFPLHLLMPIPTPDAEP